MKLGNGLNACCKSSSPRSRLIVDSWIQSGSSHSGSSPKLCCQCPSVSPWVPFWQGGWKDFIGTHPRWLVEPSQSSRFKPLVFQYSFQPHGWCKSCCLCFCFSHHKYFFAGVRIKAFPMKSIKMNWAWLPGTGNRKILGRANPLGELLEAGAQWIKHWDGLEAAKTNRGASPEHVLAACGMHRGYCWSPRAVVGAQIWCCQFAWCNPLSSCRRFAGRKSPISWSLAFMLSQRGLSSLLCINKLLQHSLYPQKCSFWSRNPFTRPTTANTGNWCFLALFLTFFFGQYICLCSELQEPGGWRGCEGEGIRIHLLLKELSLVKECIEKLRASSSPALKVKGVHTFR